ncbi:MAG: hypothetical protein V1702_00160 [Candidatus Woesearchaeota archaeon]
MPELKHGLELLAELSSEKGDFTLNRNMLHVSSRMGGPKPESDSADACQVTYLPMLYSLGGSCLWVFPVKSVIESLRKGRVIRYVILSLASGNDERSIEGIIRERLPGLGLPSITSKRYSLTDGSGAEKAFNETLEQASKYADGEEEMPQIVTAGGLSQLLGGYRLRPGYVPYHLPITNPFISKATVGMPFTQRLN